MNYVNIEESLQFVNVKLVKEKKVKYKITDEKINNCENAVKFLGEQIKYCDREQVMVVNLSIKYDVINASIISTGMINGSIVEPANVFKTAILSNAYQILIMHNHPSGNLVPSNEDSKVTKRIKECGKIMRIPLVDHIIVAPYTDEYFSFAKQGIL